MKRPAGSLSGAGGLRDVLAGRGVQIVDYAGWQRIDAEERQRGERAGKPREKFCRLGEMLDAVAA